MQTLAINVAANTTLPGFRGPIHPDGSFLYVPIPEREPTDDPVPTYGELGLLDQVPFDTDPALADRRVHFDPEFAGYRGRDRYTYGDEHGVKAGPLSGLEPDDRLLFYATLTTHDPPEWDGPRVDWRPPEWGAYVIGEFVVDEVLSEPAETEPTALPEWTASNAHRKRETVDAAVFVRGTEASRLFDRAVPLSTSTAGADANGLVTTLSNDSGRGPWWRR
ncbi:MAG: hypothetical protein J07HB67_02414, partial [halophilic archaeon J07HB67]